MVKDLIAVPGRQNSNSWAEYGDFFISCQKKFDYISGNASCIALRGGFVGSNGKRVCGGVSL